MSAKRIMLFVIAAVVLSLTAAQCVQPVVVEKEVVVTQEVEVEKEVIVEVAPERVDIVYWIFGSEGSAKADTGELWSDFYSRVINEYEKEHSGVNIDFFLRGVEAGGTTTYVDAAVAAGTPPDIYYDDIFRIRKYAQAGLLESLEGALTAEDKATYDPTILSLMTDENGLYAIPAGTGYVAYVINKTMFEEAGL